MYLDTNTDALCPGMAGETDGQEGWASQTLIWKGGGMVGHVAALSSPIPRYKAVWLIFFMLGLGTLLPWNFFMTATLVRLGDWAPGGTSTGRAGPGPVLIGRGREALTLLPASPTVFHKPPEPVPEHVLGPC